MKKRLMVILFALVLGGGVAYFMFSREYVSDVVKVKVKAFQVGVFTNYDNALKVADRNNGIVVSDDDLYRVYVSILSSEEAVDKMKKYYDSIGLHYYLRDIEVNSEFLINVRNTEELLFRSDVDAYNIINLSVLSEFEELL